MIVFEIQDLRDAVIVGNCHHHKEYYWSLKFLEVLRLNLILHLLTSQLLNPRQYKEINNVGFYNTMGTTMFHVQKRCITCYHDYHIYAICIICHGTSKNIIMVLPCCHVQKKKKTWKCKILYFSFIYSY